MTINIPLFTTLFTVLLILKLINIIHLGWLWVFGPLWMPVVLGVVFIIIVVSIVMAIKLCDFIINKLIK